MNLAEPAPEFGQCGVRPRRYLGTDCIVQTKQFRSHMASLRAGRAFAGATSTAQHLRNIRDADTEGCRHFADRTTCIRQREHPLTQVLRIRLALPKQHLLSPVMSTETLGIAPPTRFASCFLRFQSARKRSSAQPPHNGQCRVGRVTHTEYQLFGRIILAKESRQRAFETGLLAMQWLHHRNGCRRTRKRPCSPDEGAYDNPSDDCIGDASEDTDRDKDPSYAHITIPAKRWVRHRRRDGLAHAARRCIWRQLCGGCPTKRLNTLVKCAWV